MVRSRKLVEIIANQADGIANPAIRSVSSAVTQFIHHTTCIIVRNVHKNASESQIKELSPPQRHRHPHVDASKGFISGNFTLEDFPPQNIRNFSIIAHVDHGKSTLADRLMESLGAVSLLKSHQAQYLDKLQVERERGITVKAQSISLVYKHPATQQHYLLNLIDTPGHVDFSYEVSRSLAACQGALLLVDAAQGIQAQTVANYHLATDQGLAIVPIINKIDLPAADADAIAMDLYDTFDIDPAMCLKVSAKTGLGVDTIPPAIIDTIPPPSSSSLLLSATDNNTNNSSSSSSSSSSPMRALLFDAHHDIYRGVVCHVAVIDGALSKGDKVASAASGTSYEVAEVGIMAPEPHPVPQLLTGQVGYALVGIKDTRAARVGDTWYNPQQYTNIKQTVVALPGFKPAKAMVYAGIYPLSASGYEQLSAAMERLTLNDASVSVKRETSVALGAGFRCGFLGLLHLDVFRQRLEQEHGAEVLVTSPTVPVKLEMRNGEEKQLASPAEFPNYLKDVKAIWEPTVKATIITPASCLGAIMELCQDRRGDMLEQHFLSSNSNSSSSSSSSSSNNNNNNNNNNSTTINSSTGGRVLLRYILPTAELSGDFYETLKGSSSGYASFDYEEDEPRPAQLTRLDIMINGEAIDALARVVHKDRGEAIARRICTKLKELLDRQQFEVAIQAAVGGRVIARETIKAYRKNVLAKCYGGDVSRKRKLLEKQKEGKKRMRRLGQVEIPQEAFHELLKVGNASSP